MDDGEGEWLMLALQYLSIALIYGFPILMAICELLACFQRRRTRRDAELDADLLLESVPDVSYHRHQLPADAAATAADDDGGPAPPASSSCVVCMEDYREGERCFVLPGCAHAFHRGCIAPWLRQGNTTCPICRRRATPAVVTPPPPAQQQRFSSTAEDMV